MNVNKDSLIISDFIDKKQTYLGNNKNDIIKQFEKSLINNNYKNSCWFMTELLCSGYIKIIWNSIFKISFKNINIVNCKLPYYLYLTYNKFNLISSKFDKNNYINLRNNQEIRNLFTDITTIVSLSNKHAILLPKFLPKIKNINNYKSRIRSKNNIFIKNYLYDDDPVEIIIGINEIAYILNSNDHTLTIKNIFYWLQWLMMIEIKYKKQKQKFVCHSINISNINEKYNNDWIWVLWRVIKDYCVKLNSSFILSQFDALLFFYKLNFTYASKKSKSSIIQNMFLLIKSDYKLSTQICNNYSLKLKLSLINNIFFSKFLNSFNKNQNNNKIHKTKITKNLKKYKKPKQKENDKQKDDINYLNFITYKSEINNNKTNEIDNDENTEIKHLVIKNNNK